MQKTPYDIIVFLVVATILVIGMIAFILSILYLYRKRQQHFEKSLEQIKLDNEKNILSAQLEIQEETFRHISREIHDNISLSLTLAKLNLHTINWSDQEKAIPKVEGSIALITQSIAELSDVSKSLNAELIIQQGLLKAIDEELGRIRQTGLFEVNYRLEGNPVYMEARKELIIFRIIQEAFNNIIRHSGARVAGLCLDYHENMLKIDINDDGNGFDRHMIFNKKEAGLRNMETRARTLNGNMEISSIPGKGTMLSFEIPLN